MWQMKNMSAITILKVDTSVIRPKAVSLKILIYEEKPIKLGRQFAGKSFQSPKIYLKFRYLIFESPNLIGQNLSCGHILKKKVEVHIFDRANVSGFST